MSIEKRTHIERWASTAEMIAEEGSGQFHGQKLLFPNPKEKLLEVMVSLGKQHTRYRSLRLLAVFEDQYDGTLTLVLPKPSSIDEHATFERLNKPETTIILFREIAQNQLPSITINPAPISSEDKKIDNLDNFVPVTGIGIQWESPRHPVMIVQVLSYDGEILEVDGFPS